jgi:hypothetical protein
MPEHKNVGNEVEPRTVQAGSEEGVNLNDLAEGSVIELDTQHHHYTLEKRAGSQVRISGHPTFCPVPVAVQIEGSVDGLPTLNPQPGYIARGKRLMFKHPVFDCVTTSRIRKISSKSLRG